MTDKTSNSYFEELDKNVFRELNMALNVPTSTVDEVPADCSLADILSDVVDMIKVQSANDQKLMNYINKLFDEKGIDREIGCMVLPLEAKEVFRVPKEMENRIIFSGAVDCVIAFEAIGLMNSLGVKK